MCFLIWPRIKRNLSWACIIHTEMASNELARLVRRLLVYNGICARATANFWGWYKAKKTQSGQHITGRVIQFTGSSLPPFSVSNSSRSSPGGSWNWTEDEPNSYHLLANHEEGGGWSRHYTTPSQRWLRATRATTFSPPMNDERIETTYGACVCARMRVCARSREIDLAFDSRFSDFWSYNTGDNKFSCRVSPRNDISGEISSLDRIFYPRCAVLFYVLCLFLFIYFILFFLFSNL